METVFLVEVILAETPNFLLFSPIRLCNLIIRCRNEAQMHNYTYFDNTTYDTYGWRHDDKNSL